MFDFDAKTAYEKHLFEEAMNPGSGKEAVVETGVVLLMKCPESIQERTFRMLLHEVTEDISYQLVLALLSDFLGADFVQDSLNRIADAANGND